MSKVLLKIFLNGNFLITKKLNISYKLSTIRTSIKAIPDDSYFTFDDDKILKEDEDDINIEDIIKDKKIYMKSDYKNTSFSISSKLKSNNKPIIGSKLIERKGDLDIYLYPNSKFSSQEDENSKSMILVGQVGSGKTTLINSLVNYLTGINYEDNFRYKIIEEAPNQNPAESHTSEVNIYYIHSNNGYPPIKIIDTPGFGGYRGIKIDIEITKKIEKKFQDEINQINGICFIAQSSNPRLTVSQKYIFNNIINLFGNDVVENFVAILTFCDGYIPQIVNALERKDSPLIEIIPKIKKPWYYKFNNSSIFLSDKSDEFIKLFWELGLESCKNFVKKIDSLSAKSLTLSKEVLSERNNLNIFIENLQIQIQKGLNKTKIIRDLIDKNNSLKKINSSKNYEIIEEYRKKNLISIENLIKEGREILFTCITLQEKLKYSFSKLKQIALNPNILNSEEEEYIELLIQSEKEEKRMGWQNRVEGFEEMKRQQKLIRQVINGEDDNLFGIFKNELNELIRKQS